MRPDSSRLKHLDALRGVAALLVCLSHFGYTRGWYDFAITPLADAGVYIFFVISGYLIPRILSQEKYRPALFVRYLAKRLTRLHPPYIAALLITFFLSAVAARFKGVAFIWPLSALAAQAFYVSLPPDNPVFWTLQLELCFYIFLGTTFALLNSPVSGIRWAAFLSPFVLWSLGQEVLFLKFVSFFLLGIALEQYQRRAIDSWEFSLKVLSATIFMWAATSALGVAVGLIALVFIAMPPRMAWPRPVLGFGALSYSFYLLHYPVGVKFLNLAVARLPHVPPPLLAVAAFGASLFAAWALHRAVEKPAIALSRFIASAPALSEIEISPVSASARAD